MRDALLMFQEGGIREVFVVPNFISEGYFSQTVIPRELELTGRSTERTDGQLWHYCDPVGNHPSMTELLLARAREVAPGVPEGETSLLIVGHGTNLNDNSAIAAKREVDAIRQMNRYATVLNTYMEEPPLVSEWERLTSTPNVVVVPFFIADGLHSYEDIPVLLGIDAAPAGSASARQRAGEVFRRNPHHLHERSLFYASAIGTDVRFADVILDQVESFARDQHSISADFARGCVA